VDSFPAEELNGTAEHERCGTEMPWGVFPNPPSGADYFSQMWMTYCWITGCKERVTREDEVGLCPTHIEELREGRTSRNDAKLALVRSKGKAPA